LLTAEVTFVNKTRRRITQRARERSLATGRCQFTVILQPKCSQVHSEDHVRSTN